MIHYWVLVNIQDQCPNECTSPSHFYQCTNAICECYPGWTHNADCSVCMSQLPSPPLSPRGIHG